VRLLFCGSGWPAFVDSLARRLPPGASVSIWERSIPLERALAEVDVRLPSNAPIGASALAAAPRLRLIQQPAAGVDAIDLAAAAARGLPVCNAPGANVASVAETALLLMLALARRLPLVPRALTAVTIGEPVGHELRGRQLGVIGLGRTGGELARIAAALGMSVASVGSRASPAEWDALLAGSDVISVHCPLSPATRGLLDDRAFARMKPGALLVNCARGPVIDRGALERALAAGRLGGVGLDVLWEEPWAPDDPLFRRPDVLVLPHIAGSTEEAFGRIADIAVDNLRRLTAGEPLLHRVA
jgi:phosphoglycerate dehydrogenase-like enzyme